MTKVLTIEQIKKEYVNKWLLIAFNELDEDLNVLSGEVLAYSSDRNEIYAAFDRREGKSVSVEYTGKIPEDVAFVL
jgi:hypothetical protein